MTFGQHIGRGSRITSLTSCIVACFSTTILTALVTAFSTSSLEGTGIHGLALGAAVVDILALGALLIFTLVHLWKSSRGHARTPRRIWTTSVAVVLPSFIGLILSIIVLAWMRSNLHHLDSLDRNNNTPQLLGAAFAMWVIALLSEGLFFILYFSQTSTSPDAIISSRETGVFSVEERKRSPSISLSVLAPPAAFRQESPTLSARSAAPSLRDSVHQFMKPMTSRSRLIRSSSFPTDTASIHSESVTDFRRESDGFETWEVESSINVDGSPVPPATRQMPRLETIPGSRPVSPAHPLDGPFPDGSSPEKPSLPNPPARALPQRPQVYIPRTGSMSPSTSPTTATFTPPFAAPTRRPSGPNPTGSTDQLHVHPLFRTDSPIPPPVTSPGTIVLASPFAGQVISDVEHARGRKGSLWSNASRPGSPAGSRPGSARSHRPALRAQASYGEMSTRYERTPTLRSTPSMETISTRFERTPTPPPMPVYDPAAFMYGEKESV